MNRLCKSSFLSNSGPWRLLGGKTKQWPVILDPNAKGNFWARIQSSRGLDHERGDLPRIALLSERFPAQPSVRLSTRGIKSKMFLLSLYSTPLSNLLPKVFPEAITRTGRIDLYNCIFWITFCAQMIVLGP
jgi:hypothetical protein